MLVLSSTLMLVLAGCGGGGSDSDAGAALTPPTITTQPASVTATTGSSASFAVVASGSGLAYQWQRSISDGSSWSDIAGASAATYTVPVVDATMNGHQFHVVIQNPAGIVTSSAATLTVSGAPTSSTVAVSAGTSHSLALKSDGSVMAWGSNGNGELGNGSSAEASTTPVQVLLAGGGVLSGVSAISAGLGHSMALRSDGTLVAWGLNQFGQLGDGSGTNRNQAVVVRTAAGSAFSDVVRVSAGFGMSAAVRADGSVWVWGWNNSLAAVMINPTPVLDGAGDSVTGAAEVAVGNGFVLVLKSDGSLWTWGDIGGQSPVRAVPVETAPGVPVTGISGIAAGWMHALALTSGGQVLSWGGDNSAIGRSASLSQPHEVPAFVTDASGSTVTGVADVQAGQYLSVLRKGDGSLWSFGIQNLGTGTQTETYPVPVREVGGAAFVGVSTISLRNEHVLALRTDGAVWGWGRNANAQLAHEVNSPFDYFIAQPTLVVP